MCRASHRALTFLRSSILPTVTCCHCSCPLFTSLGSCPWSDTGQRPSQMLSHTDSSHTVRTHKGQQVPLWNRILGRERQNWAGEGHWASRALEMFMAKLGEVR